MKHCSRRFATLSEPMSAGPGLPPPVEAMGREAAERVAGRARRELSAPALSAVRSLFLDPDGGPACDAALREGISPATLTRAMQRLRQISAEELEGCPEEVHRPFASSLFDVLGS